MPRFEDIIKAINEADVNEKAQLIELLHNVQRQAGNPTKEEKTEIFAFVNGEVRSLITKIPVIEDIKEKDLYCGYAEGLLSLLPALYPDPKSMPEDVTPRLQAMVGILEDARPIEMLYDELSRGKKPIDCASVEKLLELARGMTTEYEKGKLYFGYLANGKPALDEDDGAEAAMTAYLETELERYQGIPSPDEDTLNTWEVALDVAGSFRSDKLTDLLKEAAGVKQNNIRFYAARSLALEGLPVPEECIRFLAEDIEYANMTYEFLKDSGMTSLFPAEYASPENLAKSDLYHWLLYPSELGQAPDAMEYIGKITYLFKKEVYHVFKFRSESDTLPDDIKGKWMIGWATEDGSGTFSNFDLLEEYEKETVEKTLKNIKRRILGR